MFENFKKFKALVQKESGLVIQAMRSKRGGESTSNKVQSTVKIMEFDDL